MPDVPISRTELAAFVGVTTAAITQLLGREDELPKKATSTKLKPKIHEALGWPPPSDEDEGEPAADALQEKLLRSWPYLDATDRNVIDMLIERHKKKT